MTKLATVRSHIRNAVLCTLVTFTLAACGSDDVSSATSAASGTSVAAANFGTIARGASSGSTTPAGGSTAGSSSGSGTPSGRPPATAGAATVDWTPPTENSDGSALTNLAGYKLYYGNSPGSLTHTVKVANPGLTAFTVTDLTSGTWYFSVSAYSSSGVESARTGTVTATL